MLAVQLLVVIVPSSMYILLRLRELGRKNDGLNEWFVIGKWFQILLDKSTCREAEVRCTEQPDEGPI